MQVTREAIKAANELGAVLVERGISLRKKGRVLVARCPSTLTQSIGGRTNRWRPPPSEGRAEGRGLHREEAECFRPTIFLGGFALTWGGELVGVHVRGTNGRRVAVFQIAGPEVQEAERDYYRGRTSVDLQLLKLQVRRLKDKAFEALREERTDVRGEERSYHR